MCKNIQYPFLLPEILMEDFEDEIGASAVDVLDFAGSPETGDPAFVNLLDSAVGRFERLASLLDWGVYESGSGDPHYEERGRELLEVVVQDLQREVARLKGIHRFVSLSWRFDPAIRQTPRLRIGL